MATESTKGFVLATEVFHDFGAGWKREHNVQVKIIIYCSSILTECDADELH